MNSTDALSPFVSMRRAYNGAKDTIKSIDIDLELNRLYAACASGGVFVWNLSNQQPFALMKHEQWVNSVRCYPPKRDSILPSVDAGRSANEVVLTACENGVLSAWNPITFLVKRRVRPGTGPLTAMILARMEKQSKKFVTTGSYNCYVASLRHVYVIQVEPDFLVLHDCVHRENVLCMVPHHSYRSQCVLCGQSDGTISCWSLSTGQYECSVEYPSDAADIEEDAKTPTFHSPTLGPKKIVEHTFAFNSERSARAVYREPRFSIDNTPEEVDKYFRTIEVDIDPFYFKKAPEPAPETAAPATVDPGYRTPEQWQLLLNDTESEATTEKGPPSEKEPNSVKIPTSGPKAATDPAALWSINEADKNITFDLRMVTCLVSTCRDSIKTHRFYSGHATGEVLVWEAAFKHQPLMLLKKIQVFSFGSWVWHMQAMEVARSENPGEVYVEDPNRLVSLQLCAWSDSGAIRYLQTTTRVVVAEGPGFLATSSYFWRGPELHSRRNLEESVSQQSEQSEGISKAATYYMIMGSMEGRLELFDLTSLVARLRNESW